jgi:hypothetical protein
MTELTWKLWTRGPYHAWAGFTLRDIGGGFHLRWAPFRKTLQIRVLWFWCEVGWWRFYR